MAAAAASATRASPDHLLYRDIHFPVDSFFDVVAARARHTPTKELILLTSNWGQYDLAVNLISSLKAHGLHHYLLLADNAALAAHAQQRGVIATVWSSMFDRFAVSRDPACACLGVRPDPWSSMPQSPGGKFTSSALKRQHSWATNFPCNGSSDATLWERARAAMRCSPSAAVFYQCHAVRRLWLMRWHYAARLIGRGYGVLLLDSDSLVFHDPYPLIHTHLDAVAAIGMEDISAWPQMTLNGGTWYLRARANGPMHALLRRFARSVLRVLRAYPATKFYDEAKRQRGILKPADFLLFDQTVLNTALLEALVGAPIELNTSQNLIPIKSSHPAHSRVQWTSSCCYPSPASFGHPPWSAVGGGVVGGGTGSSTRGGVNGVGANVVDLRAETLRPYGRATMLRVIELTDLHGGKNEMVFTAQTRDDLLPPPPLILSCHTPLWTGKNEMVVKAPAWLFSAESDAANPTGRVAATFWGAAPAPAAIVHFVCTSWPGSDGRRAAMRLWGKWHAAEVEAEMSDARAATGHARRRRAFVSFDGPVHANDPKELEPYYRLLTLVAHATRRTPVLPTMRCDTPGQQWVDERIHVRTGEMKKREKKMSRDTRGVYFELELKPKAPSRPCGWAVHAIGGEALPKPLCIQRPMGESACFHAFATPDEITPYLPHGYWPAQVHRQTQRALSLASCNGTLGDSSGSGGPCATPRVIELPRPTLMLNFRRAAAYEPITLESLLSALEPYALPSNPSAAAPAPGSGARDAPLLLLKAPSPSTLAKQRVLTQLDDFDRMLAALKKSYGPDYAHLVIGAAWSRCLKMVRTNKCTAVC